MPRVNTATKQKNKRFKGTSKGKKKAMVQAKPARGRAGKNKPIHKTTKTERVKEKKTRREREVEKATAANEYLDSETKQAVAARMKSQQHEARIILLVPCNSKASVEELMYVMAKYTQGQESLLVKENLNACTGFPAFQIWPAHKKSPLKNKLFMVGSTQDPKQLMDLAKCADIVCPIISVLSAHPQKIVEDPYNYAGAFDQAGYATINLLRSLSLPKVVGLMQHLPQVERKHHDKIEKFYRRFLESQFGDEKMMTLEKDSDITALLRVLDSCGLMANSWKDNRGYLLADHVEKSQSNSLVVGGFIKGNCINANQLVHVTGFGDYQIEKIEIVDLRARPKAMMDAQTSNNLTQFSTLAQSLDPFSRPQAPQQHEDILSAIEGLHLEQPVQQKPEPSHKENEQEMEEQAESDNEEWSDDDGANHEQLKVQEKTKRIEMVMRADDELQFQDEVEYAAEEKVREKFREYQGLKSFKSSSWNQLENLPAEYDRIYCFKNYNQTHHAAIKDNLSRGFAYPGFYVKVTIKDFNIELLRDHLTKMPIVLSFLLKHQHKMTTVHGKVQRNNWYEGSEPVSSGDLVLVSIGFRRMLVKPILSRCINGTEKTKYTKQIGQDHDNYYYCSFYGLNHFPPSPFLVFRVNPLCPDQVEGSPILRGQLVKCDPMHIILQRIILTGYPYKINKRRSTIRFMFFNPGDVKYFKPVELRTRMGLRGKIEESLGTHGLMKCMFNDPVRHNDTVCMHLYRRVYPIAEFN